MDILNLRRKYHQEICSKIIRLSKDEEEYYPNFADKGNRSSRAIATEILNQLHCKPSVKTISGQKAGNLFQKITCDFIENVFELLQHIRPGMWTYNIETTISKFDQYSHLVQLAKIVKKIDELASSLGADYIVKPDIVIGRKPLIDDEINTFTPLIHEKSDLANLTPLREKNSRHQILHASISCKWTLRSDRGQNARTESLNLIRNRKGNLPHIVAVTAEPLPSRITSLALGTGDLDCVYHFALYELEKAIKSINNEDQMDMLKTLTDGRRLRDISDLPFDLAV